jgi:hypothetical protein
MINESPVQTFVKAEQILNPIHLEMLSRNARNLYSTVWNRLKNGTQKTLWQYDVEIARRSKFRVEQLVPAQRELVIAGLVHLVPGAVQTQYELLPLEAKDNE